MHVKEISRAPTILQVGASISAQERRGMCQESVKRNLEGATNVPHSLQNGKVICLSSKPCFVQKKNIGPNDQNQDQVLAFKRGQVHQRCAQNTDRWRESNDLSDTPKKPIFHAALRQPNRMIVTPPMK
ncbi:MAG: hypothetical protein M1282_07925 [Chloroflexi bacterium]|nr:hypothetical protein [Chloroflexota bacterium]